MITVLGRIFPACFLFPRPDPQSVNLGHEMTPDIRRGSFLFLGFNHWVTSLSVESTGFTVRSSFRGNLSSSASFAFGLYVKRKMSNPAHRCTFHVWCHLFYDNSLPRHMPFDKPKYITKSFWDFGIKRRFRDFLAIDC